MQKLKKHGIINITILYGGIFAGFVNTILKAKTFTPEEIGVLSIIFTFASVAGHFIRFGTPAGLIKYYFNFKESIEQKTGFVLFNLFINITICIIACIIFLLIQPWLLDKYSNLLLKRYINFTFLFFVGNMLNNFFKEIFIAEKKTIHSTLIGDVLIRILRLGGILFFYIQDIAFSYYFLFEVAILFILSFWFLVIIKQIKLALPVFNFAKPGFLSEYFAYLLFMFFANVATILINSIDKLMIGAYISVEAVGVYTIASVFVVFLRSIGKGFAKIGQPLISEYWRTNDKAGIEKVYKENLNLQLFLGIFVFLSFVAFGQEVLRFIGKDYAGGYFVLVIIAFGELINIGTGLCGAIINYSSKYKFELYSKIFLIIVAVSTNIIFIPMWGIEGGAFATALSLGLYNVMKLLFVRIQFSLHPYNVETLKLLGLGTVSAVLMYFSLNYIEIDSIIMVIPITLIFFSLYLVISIILFRIKIVKSAVKSLKGKLIR